MPAHNLTAHARNHHRTGAAIRRRARPGWATGGSRGDLPEDPRRAAGVPGRLGPTRRNLLPPPSQRQEGRRPPFEASAQKSRRSHPGDSLDNLGNTYAQGGDWEKAVACYRRALALRPDYRKAQVNLGCVFLDQNRPEEALAQFQRHLEGSKQHYYCGVALSALGQWEDALAAYRSAVALEPADAEAHWALASTLLLLGRYEEGWRALDVREKCPERAAARRQFQAPQWDGSPLVGEAILLYEEQGLGDAIHFFRYVPLVRERAGTDRVILECPPPLRRLVMQNGDLGAQVIDRQSPGIPTPQSIRHASFLDLPFALQCWEPVPMSAPYLQTDSHSRTAFPRRPGPEPRFRSRAGLGGRPPAPERPQPFDAPEKFLPSGAHPAWNSTLYKSSQKAGRRHH